MGEYIICLVAAVLLDLLLGDPRWYTHPVRLIGWLCTFCENRWRRWLPQRETLAGTVTVLSVLGGVFIILWGLLSLARTIHPAVEVLFAVFLLYTSIATRDLLRHSKNVYLALIPSCDLEEARRRVGLIVGRDTNTLNRGGVIRASVESVAESASDGIIAPLFFSAFAVLLQGLLPISPDSLSPVAAAAIGAMLYKATNTMDSMFGYKNKKYLYFGFFAARLDDVLNYLPARLSGLCIVAACPLAGLDTGHCWRIFLRDRREHASPNAGHPEAAMAGALGIQLGGEAVYFGKSVYKPTLGDPTREIEAKDILRANSLVLYSMFVFLLGTVLSCTLLSLFFYA
ncbi:cobalamin biosynthesis protein CobD [Desulforhopalus vacuolatus]|uniref:adenosylcobinamide-phosphate synthase CbiB n=1 Tax=Desulforhopalus vacuolatus TaxID=40414 RepID=UPI0019651ABB|nr:adenosylcobinamide-phosphate synthase CbiB [Desulforhopalus vacuolatus]MBM9518975.1 cobalamin biosynthesis protein CobD [Desulforhopalus vacuolatus]